MSIGLVGRKSGMTRVFTEEGNSVLLEFVTKEEPVLAMANKWGM